MKNRLTYRAAGFTITELMVTMAIFSMVIAAVMGVHIYGLRLYEIVKPRLGISDDARRALSKLVDDIRSAEDIRIGTGTLNSFTPTSMGEKQVGNAIEIERTSGSWIRYYYFPTNGTGVLMSTEDEVTGDLVVRHTIKNGQIFTAENFAGSAYLMPPSKPVVGVLLEFSQIEYPITKIGAGNYYDYYSLRTKIYPRNH